MTAGPMRETLERHIDLYLAAGGDMPLARLVLKIGKAYAGVPFRGKPRAPKKCFENALRYAEANGLRYAEGYGLSGTLIKNGLFFPVEHAWCVDDEGNAVDPTWRNPETSLYYGIEFDVWQVWSRVSRTGTFGMFHSGPAGLADIDYMESLFPGLMAEGKRLREARMKAQETDQTPPMP